MTISAVIQFMTNKVVLKGKVITIHQVISGIKNKESALKIKTSSNFVKKYLNKMSYNRNVMAYIIHLVDKKC